MHNTCTGTVLACSKSTAVSGQDRTFKEAPQATSSPIQASQPSAPLSSFALPSVPSSRHSRPPQVPALAFNAPHPRTGLTPSLNSCPRTSLTFRSTENPHPLQTVVMSSFNLALEKASQDILYPASSWSTAPRLSPCPPTSEARCPSPPANPSSCPLTPAISQSRCCRHPESPRHLAPLRAPRPTRRFRLHHAALPGPVGCRAR